VENVLSQNFVIESLQRPYVSAAPSANPTSKPNSTLTEETSPNGTYTAHCSDEAATAAVVQALAQSLSASMDSQIRQSPETAHLHMSLHGDLGSGKTTAVRYLLKELGYTGKVKSPTYSLCEPHILQINEHSIRVYHFDFYRMQSPSEWIEAGLQEHFASHEATICIVEWPEKAGNTLPLMDLGIDIKANPDDHHHEHRRQVTFHANTPRGQGLLTNLVNRLDSNAQMPN
jgi:tRNA threonylcarbamoyladenosine biosynthesis protein TsaE